MATPFSPTHAARVLFLKRGLTIGALAARCGITPRSLTTQLTKPAPSPPTRTKIERLLAAPIWSTAADFELREQRFQQLGMDIEFASRNELLDLAAKQRIRVRRNITRKALLKILSEQIAGSSTNPRKK